MLCGVSTRTLRRRIAVLPPARTSGAKWSPAAALEEIRAIVTSPAVVPRIEDLDGPAPKPAAAEPVIKADNATPPYVCEVDIVVASGKSRKTVQRRVPLLPAPHHVTGDMRVTRWWLASDLPALVAIVRMRHPATTTAAPKSNGGNRGGGRRKAGDETGKRLIDRVRSGDR